MINRLFAEWSRIRFMKETFLIFSRLIQKRKEKTQPIGLHSRVMAMYGILER
jgi:hypothetical protein